MRRLLRFLKALPWLKIVLPIVVIAAALFLALTMVRMRPQVAIEPRPPPSLLVDVATLQRERVTFTVRSQGTVTPRTRTTLVSEVSGQIVEVAPAFVSGGMFDQGDVLVRIDPRNYEAALKRARSEVAKARTKVATEHALAGYAYQDWQRLQSLDAAARPASELALRKPQLAEAVAGLDFAQADLDRATEDLNRTVIRAPYDGMVREKRADIGQYVNTGTALAETFAIDYAEVRLPVPQSELKYLDLPESSGTFLPVVLSADIGGVEHRWSGRILRSEGVFDASSRVLHLVAQVDDPYGIADRMPAPGLVPPGIPGPAATTATAVSPATPASAGAPTPVARPGPRLGGHEGVPKREPLRVGTFVTAAVAGRDGGDLYVIPRHSLQRGDTLWMVGEDMTITPRLLDIVRSDEQFAYVATGLADGEVYTTTPPEQPLPGLLVRIND